MQLTNCFLVKQNETRTRKLNSFESPEMLKLTAPDGAGNAIASEAQAEDTSRMLMIHRKRKPGTQSFAPGDNGNGAENGNPGDPQSQNSAGYGSDGSVGKSNGQGNGSAGTSESPSSVPSLLPSDSDTPSASPTPVCIVDGIFVDGMQLTATQSGLDIMVDMSNLNRPNASGQLLSTSPVNGYLEGEVTFPDDKTYQLNYKCDESTIYWDGKKGDTSNIWYPITSVSK